MPGSQYSLPYQPSGPQQVSMEDSFSQIYGSIGTRKPANRRLKSEVAIDCTLAKATLSKNPLWRWDEGTDDDRLVRGLIYRREGNTPPLAIQRGRRGMASAPPI